MPPTNPSPNTAPNPGSLSPNRRIILVIAAVVFVIAAIGVVALSFTPSKSPKTTPTPTAAATPTPSADAVAKGPAMPTFYGFDQLLRYGVSNNQLDALKYGFFKYSKSTGRTAKEVSLKSSSIVVVPHDRYSASTSDFINFTATIDSADYPAKLEYSGYYVARLYLTDPQKGSVIFDSGTIDLFHGVGND